MKSFLQSCQLGAGVGLLGLLLSGSCALADDDEDAGPWSGLARLGYLSTSGNTDTDNVNARFELGYAAGRWNHSGFAAAIGARDEERTTAEAYELGARTTYDFNEFDYVFAQASWRKDKFSGFDQQISESLGYGRRLINTERQYLNVEIGAGARQAKLRSGESQNEAILRLGSDYEYRFNDVAAFNFDLAVESGSDNTFSEAIAAVRTQLLGRLALLVSFTARHNSSVPVGTSRTDTFSALSLEYKF